MAWPGVSEPRQGIGASGATSPTDPIAPSLRRRIALSPVWPWLIVLSGSILWAVTFGGLAIARHEAGGTHAEDLGFTDQVVWNFLRGHWFQMSVYQGATWNTELELRGVAQGDSLLAFHLEPMLLLFVPLYALGADVHVLLALQALALGLGALPAYALGSRWGGSRWSGGAVAAAYLLSPLGQWTALADFHTTALAAPLLLLSVERLSAGRAAAAVLAAGLAITAREDVALVVAGLGVMALLLRWAGHARGRAGMGAHRSGAGPALTPPLGERGWWPGALLLVLGLGWGLASALVIQRHSGGVPPFGPRYELAFSGLTGTLESLGRSEVIEYALILLLGGGWLALLSPLSLLPALPALALNVLSSSPWMASGKGHYSALVLPFLITGAAAGMRIMGRGASTVAVGSSKGESVGAAVARGEARIPGSGHDDNQAQSWVRGLRSTLCRLALVTTGLIAYLFAGAGPGGAYFGVPPRDEHDHLVETVGRGIPAQAAVSASSSLVPKISRRPKVYVFPAVEDADYVFLDVTASPAPTSAGDVFLRVRTLLREGGWSVEHANDGLLLLARTSGAPPMGIADLPAQFYTFVRVGPSLGAAQPMVSYLGGRLALLSAELLPPPEGPIAPRYPRGVLRTIWQARAPLPAGTQLEFWLTFEDGTVEQRWDIASLWWYPPERWAEGESVRVEVRNVPLRGLREWSVIVRPHGPIGH